MQKGGQEKMIYVTGDTHGERARWDEKYFPMVNTLDEKDYVIVCGDFGFLFRGTQNPEEAEFLNELEQKKFHILFVDGNHENFPLIFSYPQEEWNGGKVHRIRKNILHLMRGQVYSIDGKTFFTMGGAYSIDKAFREEGISWWPEELPSEEEYDEAINNLEKCNNKVDYIITHAAPEDTMSVFHKDHLEELKLNFFLEWVRENVEYRHWYFGHLHQDADLWRNQTVLWFQIRNVETNVVVENKTGEVDEGY